MVEIFQLQLHKSSAVPLYQQLAEGIEGMITDGVLLANSKLPPIRKTAEHFGVNSVTIVNAYKLLEKKQLVYSRVGSGTFVSPLPVEHIPEPVASRNLRSFESGLSMENAINFTSTSLPNEMFPVDAFKEAFNAVLDREKGGAFRPASAGSRRHLCVARYAAAGRLSHAGASGTTVEDIVGNTMDRMQKAEAYRKELGKTGAPARAGTDPELAAIRERLEYGEIAGQGCLDARQRRLITLVVLAAIQTPEGIGEETRAALHQGVRPEEIREALYQCAPYIGFLRTEAALRHADAALEAAGIALPLPEGGTVSEEDRFEKGLAVQTGIFGDAISKMHASVPEGQREILVYADKNASAKEQCKVHRQDGRGGFDGAAIDSAPKELGAVPLAEGRGSIGKQDCQCCGFHAACRRPRRAANEHQKDHHAQRCAGHGG